MTMTPKEEGLCESPSECQSGFCVDGVCCDTACDGANDLCVPDGTCLEDVSQAPATSPWTLGLALAGLMLISMRALSRLRTS